MGVYLLGDRVAADHLDGVGEVDAFAVESVAGDNLCISCVVQGNCHQMRDFRTKY